MTIITDTLSLLLTILPPLIVVLSLYFIIKRSGSYEKSAVEFILQNFEMTSAHDYYNQDKFIKFRELVIAGKGIAAVKEYQQIMHVSLNDSRLAVKVAKRILKI